MKCKSCKQPASTIGCLIIGVVLVVLSIILILGAFTWYTTETSLYDLSDSVITGMLGCASLIIGTIFIVVGIVLAKIEKRSS
ncbi:hypothetical protein [Fastidiosibacter lacustris]|uniref:hypothetical protein n=1 Tax=Fastidiosibacter lacustris TaxID=2056695 RepID=UPI000E348887|nr:hypothetical protein [Fastidiosibacter lacustris]